MRVHARTFPRRQAGVVHRKRVTSAVCSSLGRTAIGIALLGVAVVPPLAAQTTVSVTGRVTAQGRPVADAQIGVTDRETNRVRGTRTSANGDYAVAGLAPGVYSVRVLRVGFAPLTQEIRLLVGQRATLNFELQETAVTLSGVQVSAEPRATFEAQRTDISAPVVQAEIQNLPLNTRNTLNLAAIVPGIKTYATTAGR